VDSEQAGVLLEPVPSTASSREHPNTLALSVARQVWRHLFEIYFVFFVTLAVFPTVLVKGTPFRHDYTLNTTMVDASGAVLEVRLANLLAIFLNFAVSASAGVLLANYIQWPSHRYLSVGVLSRFVFIPIFISFAFSNDGGEPEFVSNKLAFALTNTAMALTHGHMSSLAAMYAPRGVGDPRDAGLVGMMVSVSLVAGVASGIAFAFVISHFMP